MLIIISRSIFISLSISIFIARTPLLIGIWVLLIALTISWLRRIIYRTWFAIVIFLIYIGGILVIFAYFTALTPNQSLGFGLLIISFIITNIITLLLFNYSYSLSPNILFTPNSNINISIITLYYPLNTFLLLIIASTLFLILVAVVKIALITKGPLRPFK